MRQNLFILLFVVFFSPGMVGAQESAGKAKFVPPDGQVLLIIGQDKEVIDNYVRKVKVKPAGVMFYTAIQDLTALSGPFNPDGSGVEDFPYLLNHYPRAVIQIGLYMVGVLDDVIAGKYDDNIEKMASTFQKTNRPIYLRIGYEFDSPDNHYDSHKYIKAFQHIVDTFRQSRVTNVAYVWHSYAVINSQKPIRDWYPGDDYVDWVAISYFNPYNTDNMNKVAAFAREHGKPLMIAEATPAGFPTSQGEDTWKRWYAFVFKYIDEQDVKVFCYINSQWDQLPPFASFHWGDSRIEANPVITSQWRKTMAQRRFLKDAPGLFEKLGYKPKIQ